MLEGVGSGGEEGGQGVIGERLRLLDAGKFSTSAFYLEQFKGGLGAVRLIIWQRPAHSVKRMDHV